MEKNRINMAAVHLHTNLSRIIDTQIGLRSAKDESTYYQKQPDGVFWKDVDTVVSLLKKNRHLVPDRPLWSLQCSAFRKGRCTFGHDCNFAHGKVLLLAMQRFRESISKQVSRKTPLSASQAERLLHRVQEAHNSPQVSRESYGLQELLAPSHPYASCDLIQALSPEEQRALLQKEDGTPLFIDFMVEISHLQQQPTSAQATASSAASVSAAPSSLPSRKSAAALAKATKAAEITTSNPFDILSNETED
jgi:hypothetical protein